MSPREYWTEFARIGGLEPAPAEFFRRASEKQIRGIKTSMTERPPWEANIPFEKLANSRFANSLFLADGSMRLYRQGKELVRRTCSFAKYFKPNCIRS